MNTYSKYTANVFLAKCTEKYKKNDVIEVVTKYGREIVCIVYNLIYEKDGFYYYSIVRADGLNSQERAKQKSEKYKNWGISAENKSDDFFKSSQEGRDFLSLGEPIKVGHHSEKRHRALIERNHNRMGKCIEFSEKAENHERKSEYWAKKAKDINLSMPESIDFYHFKFEEATEYHEGLKLGKYEREHSYSLTYAKKAVNEAQKNLDIAKKLWG
jgi:hypothetical protein